MKDSIISCLKFVKKGFAKKIPDWYLHDENYCDILIGDSDDNESGRDDYSANVNESENDITVKKDKATDNDDDEPDVISSEQFLSEDLNEKLMEIAHAELSETEIEEMKIYDSDYILICGNAEVDTSSIEVYIYDEDNESFFVHHDFLINSYPLCIETLNEKIIGNKQNFAAIGAFDNTINIWDLDVLDKLDPVISLGKNKYGHTSAVTTLQKNPQKTNVLISGSADYCIKIWDLAAFDCLYTYDKMHTDKVQSTKWHNYEVNVFASLGYDHKLVFADIRNPIPSASVSIDSDPETLLWSRHYPHIAMCSTESGDVLGVDLRCLGKNKNKFTFSLKAHKKATTSMAESCEIKDIFITASLDGSAKVWDIRNFFSDVKPTPVQRKKFNSGEIYSCDASDDSGELFAFGGYHPVIWNITESKNITSYFNLN